MYKYVLMAFKAAKESSVKRRQFIDGKVDPPFLLDGADSENSNGLPFQRAIQDIQSRAQQCRQGRRLDQSDHVQSALYVSPVSITGHSLIYLRL